MKYSLKNRQFRKRNNIFGDRKREELNNDDIYQDLKKIEEASEEPEDSNIDLSIKNNHKEKEHLYKFINFQNCSQQKRDPPNKQYRAYSNEHRPGKHRLSPVNKPLLDNPNIRLTQSQIKLRNSKNCDIDSETVSFSYVPSLAHREQERNELKVIFAKLYSILCSNSQRIDQLQGGIKILFDRSQLMMREFNQGIKSLLKMEEQTDLLFNTMRSVYENLRICKLKQENLELYFKQCSEKQPQTTDHAIDRTVKYSIKKSLSSKQTEQIMTQQQKESRQLACLIDYESDSSLNDININEVSVKRQTTEPVFKKYPQSQNVPNSTICYKGEKSNCEDTHQLSPFQTNKIISVANQSMNQSRTTSPSFLLSPHYSKLPESQFSTFRAAHSQSQYLNQETKLKNWIQSTNQRNIRCWLDEMGCLRRPNNTYMFDDRGEVVTLSSQGFKRLTEEGYLTSVYE